MLEKSVDKQTKKFHESNCGFNFMLLVKPYNSISLGHDNFPNNLFRNVVGWEVSVFRNNGSIVSLLKFDKISSTHPKVIDVPTFEDISEIFPKKQTFESTLLVYYVDP